MSINKLGLAVAFCALSACVFATDYYWIGGESGEWANVSNWSLSEGGSAAEAYPNSFDDDTTAIIATEGVTVTIGADVSTSNVVVNANATLTGSGMLSFYRMNGTGVITLSGANLCGAKAGGTKTTYTYYLDNDVIIADNTTNVIKVLSYTYFCMNGSASGSGMIRFDEANQLYYGFTITGNWQEFSGSFVENKLGGNSGSQSTFGSYLSVSPKANYNLCGRNRQGSSYPFSFSDNESVYIGALNGEVNLRKNASSGLVKKMVIGSRNENCSFGGWQGYADNSYEKNIIKVGTAELEFTGGWIYSLDLSNGVYRVGSTNSVPRNIYFNGGILKIDNLECEDLTSLDVSSKIKNSTEQIVFDDEGVDRTWATVIDASNKKGLTKKGSGTLSLKKQAFNGPLVVENGKIGLCDEFSGEEETLFTWTTAGSSATIDSFDIAVPSSLSLLLVTDETEGTTSLNVIREAGTYTWAGTSGGLWSDASNWTSGGESVEIAPSSLDTVVIGDDMTVVVNDDHGIGTITLGSNSKLAVIVPADGTMTFTLPSGLSSENIIAAGPYTLAYDSESGFTATRVASSFTWTGAEDSTWSKAANWLVAGMPTSVAPGSKDEVAFNDSAVTKTISNSASDFNVSNMIFNTAMTLEGHATTKRYFVFYGFNGSGKITLKNACLRPNSYTSSGSSDNTSTIVIANDFEIVEGTTNYFMTACKSNDDYIYTEYSGSLSGKGCLILTAHDSRRRGGNWLSGDNADFEGEVRLVDNNNYNRSYHHFSKAQSVGPKMSVCLKYSGSQGYAGIFPFQEKNATYEMGALNGSVDYYSEDNGGAPYLKVGARNEDCTITGDWLKARSGDKAANVNIELEWVATSATMNYGVAKTAVEKLTGGGTLKLVNSDGLPLTALTFSGNGGTLKTGYDLIADETDDSITNAVPVDPSAKIVNSTAAIIFDDEGTNRTWSTALAASNVGGFTKKGAGTLTLSAAPAYTGATKVEDGTLVLPALGDGETAYIAYDVKSAGILATSAEATELDKSVIASYSASGVWHYKVDSWNDATVEVDISGLTAIDMTAMTEDEIDRLTKSSEFTLITAKSLKGLTNAAAKSLEITWPEDVTLPCEFVARISNGSLVVKRASSPLVIRMR